MKPDDQLIEEAKRLVKETAQCDSPHDRGFCVGASWVLQSATMHHKLPGEMKSLRKKLYELYEASEPGFWRGFWSGKVWAIDFVMR